jgi:hypothetical protein
LFIAAAKSESSFQRSSSVQLSRAISTNCGGRSTARTGTLAASKISNEKKPPHRRV